MTNSDRYWTVYCLGQDGHSTSLARFKWSLRVSLRATARDGPASEILARRPARVNPLRSLADLAQWPCPGTVIMPVMLGLLPRLPDVAPIRDIGPAAPGHSSQIMVMAVRYRFSVMPVQQPRGL